MRLLTHQSGLSSVNLGRRRHHRHTRPTANAQRLGDAASLCQQQSPAGGSEIHVMRPPHTRTPWVAPLLCSFLSGDEAAAHGPPAIRERGATDLLLRPCGPACCRYVSSRVKANFVPAKHPTAVSVTEASTVFGMVLHHTTHCSRAYSTESCN